MSLHILKMVVFVNSEKRIRDVTNIKRQVLEAEGSLHRKEDGYLCFEREGPIRQVILCYVVLELRYLF